MEEIQKGERRKPLNCSPTKDKKVARLGGTNLQSQLLRVGGTEAGGPQVPGQP